MKKNLEVIETESTTTAIVPQNPMELAQRFLANGGDLENLEKMLALQEKYDSMQAKKAYTVAVAKFKSEPLPIIKDKVNTQFGSPYVSIGQLVNSALPGMGKCGLSHKWDIDQTDPKNIKVSCIVTHSDGHSESVSMSAPPDVSGGNSKNAIQQIKSTITYLRSATFEGIMGLASTDANVSDDGNIAGAKLIDEKQAGQITDMINSIEDFSEESFLSWAKLESIDQMPVYDFGKNINALKAKAKVKK